MHMITALMMLGAALFTQTGGVVGEQDLDGPGGAVSRPSAPARPAEPAPAPAAPAPAPAAPQQPAAPQAQPVPVREATPADEPMPQTAQQFGSEKPVAAFWVVLPD